MTGLQSIPRITDQVCEFPGVDRPVPVADFWMRTGAAAKTITSSNGTEPDVYRGRQIAIALIGMNAGKGTVLPLDCPRDDYPF